MIPNPLDGPYLDPELTPNHRTPYLDLDHVYGTWHFFNNVTKSFSIC